MLQAIPTDLLLRLMNATPEQYAAVAKILGVSAACGSGSAECSTPHQGEKLKAEIEKAERGTVVAGTSSGSQPPSPQEKCSQPLNPHPVSGHPLPLQRARDMIEAEEVSAREDARPTLTVDVARAAFAFLVSLDAEGKPPTPVTVFRLYCVEGYSADAVARKCRCGKATVIRRLRFIEAVTKTRPEQFRAMSGHLQQMDDDLRASGAREIYRRGLVSEGED
jgi:hypothetical protein